MRAPLFALATIALFSLSACSTPLQNCISNAQSERAQLSSKIQVAQGNIARGYAIHSQSVPFTYVGVCYDDAGVRFSCPQSDTRREETPVAIDISEERQKLGQLQRQLISANVRADAEIAQCRLVHISTG